MLRSINEPETPEELDLDSSDPQIRSFFEDWNQISVLNFQNLQSGDPLNAYGPPRPLRKQTLMKWVTCHFSFARCFSAKERVPKVESDWVSRRLIRLIVGSFGCCLATRSNGKKSTSEIRRNPPKKTKQLFQKCLGWPEWCVNSSESSMIDQETTNPIWRIFEHFLLSQKSILASSPDFQVTQNPPKVIRSFSPSKSVQYRCIPSYFCTQIAGRTSTSMKKVAWTFFVTISEPNSNMV